MRYQKLLKLLAGYQTIADAGTVLPRGTSDLAFLLAEGGCDADASAASRRPCVSGAFDVPIDSGSPSQDNEAW